MTVDASRNDTVLTGATPSLVTPNHPQSKIHRKKSKCPPHNTEKDDSELDADRMTEERYNMYVESVLKKRNSFRSSDHSSSSSCSVSSTVNSYVTANEDNSIRQNGHSLTESVVRETRRSRGVGRDCLPTFALDLFRDRLCGNETSVVANTSSNFSSDSTTTILRNNSTVAKGLPDWNTARLLARTKRLVREKDEELRQAQILHQTLVTTNDSTVRELTQQCQKVQAENRELQEELEQVRNQVKQLKSQLKEHVLQSRQHLQGRQQLRQQQPQEPQSYPIRIDGGTVATVPRSNHITSSARVLAITPCQVKDLLEQLMAQTLNCKPQLIEHQRLDRMELEERSEREMCGLEVQKQKTIEDHERTVGASNGTVT